jgi:hypothetical protein
VHAGDINGALAGSLGAKVGSGKHGNACHVENPRRELFACDAHSRNVRKCIESTCSRRCFPTNINVSDHTYPHVLTRTPHMPYFYSHLRASLCHTRTPHGILPPSRAQTRANLCHKRAPHAILSPLIAQTRTHTRFTRARSILSIHTLAQTCTSTHGGHTHNTRAHVHQPAGDGHVTPGIPFSLQSATQMLAWFSKSRFAARLQQNKHSEGL